MTEGFLIGLAITALGSAVGCLFWVWYLLRLNKVCEMTMKDFQLQAIKAEEKAEQNYHKEREIRYKYQSEMGRVLGLQGEIKELHETIKRLRSIAHDLSRIPGTQVNGKGRLEVIEYSKFVQWLGEAVPQLSQVELAAHTETGNRIQIRMDARP